MWKIADDMFYSIRRRDEFPVIFFAPPSYILMLRSLLMRSCPSIWDYTLVNEKLRSFKNIVTEAHPTPPGLKSEVEIMIWIHSRFLRSETSIKRILFSIINPNLFLFKILQHNCLPAKCSIHNALISWIT